jgi:DNA-binding transcriptional LysR family regulator
MWPIVVSRFAVRSDYAWLIFKKLEQAMRLDLDALHTFEVVIREASLARAAQQLHRVQSAVSYQLKKLEQQLGVGLLNREGYRIKLTLAEGRRLLTHAAHIGLLGQQFKAGWEPRLMLVVDDILPLAPILAAKAMIATCLAANACSICRALSLSSKRY